MPQTTGERTMTGETQRAYDWAINTPHQSVAARYACLLAKEVARLNDEFHHGRTNMVVKTENVELSFLDRFDGSWGFRINGAEWTDYPRRSGLP